MFTSVDDLEAALSEPTPGVVTSLAQLPGDILVLGVAGKMGMTLARMARRALDQLGRQDRVIGVARFSSPAAEEELARHGIQAVRCNLLDREALARLPDAPNVIFMAGQKFGTAHAPEQAWAANTVMPALVAERFC